MIEFIDHDSISINNFEQFFSEIDNFSLRSLDQFEDWIKSFYIDKNHEKTQENMPNLTFRYLNSIVSSLTRFYYLNISLFSVSEKLNLPSNRSNQSNKNDNTNKNDGDDDFSELYLILKQFKLKRVTLHTISLSECNFRKISFISRQIGGLSVYLPVLSEEDWM